MTAQAKAREALDVSADCDMPSALDFRNYFARGQICVMKQLEKLQEVLQGCREMKVVMLGLDVAGAQLPLQWSIHK